MFIAVDRAESGYALVGEIHYSLAGERALFRVISLYHSVSYSIVCLNKCCLLLNVSTV